MGNPSISAASRVAQTSRRTFLEGAALGAGAIALGTQTMAQAEEAAPQDEAAATEGDAMPACEVYQADIIVVGGGLNAVPAVQAALSKGASVIMVDKGPARQSGASGMCWDAFSMGPAPALEDIETFTLPWLGRPMVQSQVSKQALLNALQADPEPDKFVYIANAGESLPSRMPDGTIAPYAAPNMCMGMFARHEVDTVISQGKAAVIDQTMITDILVNEGQCVGVVGVHLPTGDLRVFRGKAVVTATGPCAWIYGWIAVAAINNGSADNTGDLDMAAWRHGAGIGDAEYAQFDVMSIYPTGLACGFGTSVCGDAQEAHAILDVNGERVFPDEDERASDRNYFCQRLAEVIVKEGRGTENGGIYIQVPQTELRYANERNLPLYENKFDIHPREELVEAAPEMFEHGGAPVVDASMMSEIPGLFCARATGVYGENGGTSVWHNRVFGTYAGLCAAEYASQMEQAPAVDWEGVRAEYDRLHKILSQEPEDGLRPHVVRHAIQAAGYQGFGVYRTTEGMEAAIAELERIRTEDIDRQVILEKSPTFNKDWKEAIENYNLLDMAEMSIRASLMREETRGSYLRAEFPEQDDENWACTLVCHKDGDAGMAFEKIVLE